MYSIEDFSDVRAIAQIIAETIREPLLILNRDFRILLATDSFLRLFSFRADEIRNVSILELQDGAWNIPQLAYLLKRTVADQVSIEDEELTNEFPSVGKRALLATTRLVKYENIDQTTIFLSFLDVTEQRAMEREKAQLHEHTNELLRQKDMLLREMEHRVVNSLQIIASILMLKAKGVSSPETRHHLEDAHRRVMSVAAVQKHLHALSHADTIEVAPYLEKLCQSLAASIIGDNDKTKLISVCDVALIKSGDAVSLGLIVTELVINSLKYAFPNGRDSARVRVTYETNGPDWRLSVTDNGAGMAVDVGKRTRPGLGTSLVKALAEQMDAKVGITSSDRGTEVVITHATFSKAA